MWIWMSLCLQVSMSRFSKNFVSMPRPWPWRGHGHRCPFSSWPYPPNSVKKVKYRRIRYRIPYLDIVFSHFLNYKLFLGSCHVSTNCSLCLSAFSRKDPGLRTVQYVYHGFFKPIHVLETLSEVSILKLSKLSFEFGLLDCCGDGTIISTVNGDFLFCLDNWKRLRIIC